MTSETARLISYRKFDGDHVTLSTLSEPAPVNGLGPVVRVSLYDQRTYSGPTASLVLGDDAEQRLTAALARLEVPGAARAALAAPLSELHWLDADQYRREAVDLLTGAYRALGRDALAGIAEVHAAHRDLPSVDVLY
ncbi:hypothetical protein ACFPIJ_30575 [Dactylosporangium cerinum]|uniref:Uncharacterized protein n=1 Tax=Dactylosporangium cerinum TaxID=1434730 RepID=A0ABV9W2V9_9ACTN